MYIYIYIYIYTYIYIYIYIYIYLSLCIFLSCPIFYCEVFETFVILSAISFLIKSPVVSVAFSISLFKAVVSGSVADCLA